MDDWNQYGPGSYIYDHEHDKTAHRSLMDEHVKEWHVPTRTAILELQKFQQRAIGGFIVLGSLIGGGLLVVLLHLVGVPV